MKKITFNNRWVIPFNSKQPTKNLKHLSIIILVFCFFNQNTFSQIFTEDFEAASSTAPIQAEHELSAASYLNWESAQFTAQTNDNYWWIFDNTRCNVITGNYSMAVSQNNPVTSGTLPQYATNRRAYTLGYHTVAIDATNYMNITLDFNWIAGGEAGEDYGNVVYSTDGGNTWFTIPGDYLNQNTTQSVTNLDLSVVDGQIFHLGFSWITDNNGGDNLGFVVDDIVVNGTLLTPCTTPNQPTTLSLTPTGDTINGSFNVPGANQPDNYLVVISTSATAPTPTNGTVYNIGDNIGAGYTVVDNDSDTLFTATGLNPSTTYYIYIFSFNTGCLGEPTYNATNPLTGSTTTTNSTYCTPATSNNVNTRYINDVEFIGTLNDITNNGNGSSSTSNGYSDYTGLTNCIQAQGEGVNIYVGSNSGRGHFKAWVDWNKDGIFNNDASEIVYDSAGIATSTTTFGFVIPAGQQIGDYRIRIRFFNSFRSQGPNVYEYYAYDFNACETFSTLAYAGRTYTAYGEAEDYLFTVVQSCPAKITSLTEGTTCGPGSVTLSVTGSAGVTGFNWYDSETGGNLITTTNSGNFTPIVSQTTTYWVTATNGSCESLVRTKIVATVNPVSELTINSANSICGEDNIIEISATGDTELAYLIDEDFEGGGLGVFTGVNYDLNGTAIDDLSEWQNETSTYVPSNLVWFPAISSGFGTNNFAMSTSDVNPTYYVENSLESPTVDTSSFNDLTLDFDMYFSRYVFDNSNPGLYEFVYIDVSTDGGTNWTNIQVYDNDIGYGTSFESRSLDLSAYVDEPNFKIRVYYFAAWCDGVAIDNIQLYGTRDLIPSFTWTSATTIDAYTNPAATIPYVSGTATLGTIYIKPSITQLEDPNFTFTANATLTNGCIINKDITIQNKTKVWQGLSSNWNDPSNWKPSGIPDNTNCVIIPDKPIDPIITSGIDGDAFSLSVKDDALLTINAGATLTVVDLVNIDTLGEIILDGINGAVDGSSSSASGSLIQVDDSAVNTGTGKLTLNRNTFVRSRDYVYWSSPVENYAVTSILNTPNIFKWIPTIFVDSATQFGNWTATTENMLAGKGYIVRGGPEGNGTNDTAAWNTATFEGIPNNGIITIPILRGTCMGNGCGGTGNGGTNGTDFTEDDDNWNLVGNPYPSALSALEFLQENSEDNDRIEGTVYLWTHGTKIRRGNSPFFGEFVFNYDIDDYTEFNYTGSTGGFNGFIGSGQGFFVLMDDASPSGTNLVFNNSMRDRSYESGVQFFRNSSETANNRERHRIWLDLIPPSRNVSTTLIGYVDGANNTKDKLFDAKLMNGSTKKLYSIIEGSDKKFSIQGRGLPFDQNDKIKLGIILEEDGEYAINIQEIDGLFETENQAIFLEDLELDIVHNLSISPYFFNASEIGEFTNRFQISFTNNALSIDELDNDSGISISAPNNEYIKVKSYLVAINSITIYDLLGRKLVEKKQLNHDELEIHDITRGNVFMVKVILTDGSQKIQKVILK